MNKYIKYLSISVQEALVYKQNYFISTAISIISTFILIYLWNAIYIFSNKTSSYNLYEMTEYLLFCNAIYRVIETDGLDSEISDEIRMGSLSCYLLRPFSYFKAKFSKILGKKFVTAPIIVIPYIIILFLVENNRSGVIITDTTFLSILVCISILIFAYAFNFIIDFLLGLIAFWIENPYILFFVKDKLLPLLCGIYVPLSFFPATLQKVLNILPFSYYVSIPFDVLVGQIDIAKGFKGLIVLLLWLVAICIITYVIWKVAIKRYTAIGG